MSGTIKEQPGDSFHKCQQFNNYAECLIRPCLASAICSPCVNCNCRNKGIESSIIYTHDSVWLQNICKLCCYRIFINTLWPIRIENWIRLLYNTTRLPFTFGQSHPTVLKQCWEKRVDCFWPAFLTVQSKTIREGCVEKDLRRSMCCFIKHVWFDL